MSLRTYTSNQKNDKKQISGKKFKCEGITTFFVLAPLSSNTPFVKTVTIVLAQNLKKSAVKQTYCNLARTTLILPLPCFLPQTNHNKTPLFTYK